MEEDSGDEEVSENHFNIVLAECFEEFRQRYRDPWLVWPAKERPSFILVHLRLNLAVLSYIFNTAASRGFAEEVAAPTGPPE